MFFEAVDQAVVPVEEQISKIWSVWVFEDASFHLAMKGTHLAWKQITAVHVLLPI